MLYVLCTLHPILNFFAIITLVPSNAASYIFSIIALWVVILKTYTTSVARKKVCSFSFFFGFQEQFELQ
jgi:hypothetical protein